MGSNPIIRLYFNTLNRYLNIDKGKERFKKEINSSNLLSLNDTKKTIIKKPRKFCSTERILFFFFKKTSDMDVGVVLAQHWEGLHSGAVAIAHLSSDNVTTVIAHVGSLDPEFTRVILNKLELYPATMSYPRLPTGLGIFDNCYANGSIPLDTLRNHSGVTKFLGNNVSLVSDCLTKIKVP